MDLIALAEKWLGSTTYSLNTRKTYLTCIRLLARRYPAQAVNAFSEQDLILFLTQDAKGHKTAHSPNSILSERTALKSFFSWCEMEGHVKRDPAIRLDRRVDVKSVGVRTGWWLERHEITRLLAACDDGTVLGMRDKVLVSLGLLTGLRRAELSKLRWGHVDLSRREIRLDARMAKGGKAALVGIPDQLASVLGEWHAYLTEDSGVLPSPTETVLCPVRVTIHEPGGMAWWGCRLGVRGIGTALETRAAKAGLTRMEGHLAPHDLRRSFCSLLKEKGVSLEDRQAAMRHSSPVTTQQVYDRKDPRQGLRAVEGLEL